MIAKNHFRWDESFSIWVIRRRGRILLTISHRRGILSVEFFGMMWRIVNNCDEMKWTRLSSGSQNWAIKCMPSGLPSPLFSLCLSLIAESSSDSFMCSRTLGKEQYKQIIIKPFTFSFFSLYSLFLFFFFCYSLLTVGCRRCCWDQRK